MSEETSRIIGSVSRRTAVKAIGATIGTSVVSGTAVARDGRENGKGREKQTGPYITAHRGFRDVYPQNTVAAVEGASRLGTERIEIDVEATSDGEVVVFHDAALDDLTDKEGLVSETPSETVLQAEVLDSGETIPTLAEVLNATRPNVTMNIEFKESGPLSWTEFAKRTLRIASQYPGEFYVSSFDPDAIRAVRDIDSSVDVAPIFGRNKDENLEIARELDAKAVNPSVDVLDRDLVETAHEEGREVNVWTIDSWREAQKPLELGVDGLIADYPNMDTFGTSDTRRHPPEK
ncbi:glycerophosphodiester phosphodiesterase (plasmid) [Haloferax mediterranei ATCC 33500]|uniref:Glycerophosphodiester phosphodiesterase n=1 Tax=Haloferax mediterranei (strain ATCC 33500 / DSM 1411 / JCM 8866 / NBRC 14739 / NCIMB 2177 / R-4) TaxID=523841 RepID=I3RB39_HALMT|nr:glycerophosphodiester phosphodiesterase [Haloferax mediterranei]AFK21449.1 glycerophosphoryl diester phosphodiesterase [Haloferax mediterranei ATCC 33500]AHZ24483.1 glycerophosphodiester phosphodiesterase [Haloferax mediterranei ATCC 33500]ELZ97233.1 glycerophosphoryl diester phosphodiesterase [Haloferax mediterranei ATCC 33500]MDX5990030.1 glycerophosphodiester phosphodiesterase [Haloferax mediterranei ATCC 33500]QCQ76882.1 glycerophosphodiester phosphodiesterase [Haloferax mediterranei AT